MLRPSAEAALDRADDIVGLGPDLLKLSIQLIRSVLRSFQDGCHAVAMQFAGLFLRFFRLLRYVVVMEKFDRAGESLGSRVDCSLLGVIKKLNPGFEQVDREIQLLLLLFRLRAQLRGFVFQVREVELRLSRLPLCPCVLDLGNENSR